MQKKYLLVLFFIFTNFLFAQKKEKIVKVIPPSISHYLDYSAYVWMCEKKDHSIKILDFEPYSENVALISKTKDLKELSKNKFIYSITENDVMILKNSSTKILLKIVPENNPLKLINTKSKETFIAKFGSAERASTKEFIIIKEGKAENIDKKFYIND